ncbi:Aldo/keto reductase [Fomitiporia mediterranea MF3/22]|uniref:Aldo/keto reductase n=1 Tax=Fomitiporia mediterranea (strain MF3/22) TaxID=694068 RepID=UPI0004409B39|nr:Aldo/keto reductase [Fomitiporia mediterranea MF3/22]EJD05990.1 Aldo/keto reductase [Fomitiporia mediterranea MF3/22]
MGVQGKNGVRNHDLKDCQEIIDVFYKHGNKELDTARVYAGGTTEEYLAQLDLKDCTIDTKVYPVNPGDHHPEKLRATFKTSLEKLGRPKVRVLYLHAPDRSVPFEDTLREMNNMYNEGLFEIFGLSNYAAWEVAEIAITCQKNGWVQPKIYQAMYNAITRSMESELVPCCRKFGLRIVVYNPLAGGFFAGKLVSANDAPEPGSRFDASAGPMGTMYRNRYFKDGFFQALPLIKEVADKHGLRLTEIALRWMQHHSALSPSDGVILGASSAAQLEQNCVDSEKGPLPQDVVQTLDEAYKVVGFDSPAYWR